MLSFSRKYPCWAQKVVRFKQNLYFRLEQQLYEQLLIKTVKINFCFGYNPHQFFPTFWCSLIKIRVFGPFPGPNLKIRIRGVNNYITTMHLLIEVGPGVEAGLLGNVRKEDRNLTILLINVLNIKILFVKIDRVLREIRYLFTS